MHKVAVLLDGGYVLWELRNRTFREATAAEIESVARRCVGSHEDLFRIYYYDCMPFGGSTRHPVTGDLIDFQRRSLTDTALIFTAPWRRGTISPSVKVN